MVVDLIIPVLNEEPNMAALLMALPREHVRRVVVVDNGSTDRTAELARRGAPGLDVVVVSEDQRGYGAACLAGLGWIKQQGDPPDAVAFLDADLSDDPGQLPRLAEPIARGEADLVIGSRPRLAEPGALESHQRFGNALACWLIRLVTGRRYGDLGPMRVIGWSSLVSLGMADRSWGWTVEMQFKAACQGLRTLELDVPYRRRRAGRSKISGSLVGTVRAGCKIVGTIGYLAWQRGGARQRRQEQGG